MYDFRYGKILALRTFLSVRGRPGGAEPLRQLLVWDKKCFPYDKHIITVYSHTKQKRKEKDISPAYKLSYEHSSNGYNIKHLPPTAQCCC